MCQNAIQVRKLIVVGVNGDENILLSSAGNREYVMHMASNVFPEDAPFRTIIYFWFVIKIATATISVDLENDTPTDSTILV